MASGITLRQLTIFLHVSQSGSLSDAAAKLYLSKAAVSIAISELEKQLGHTVFDRINNRLQLNHQGKQLQPLADELLARHAEIEQLGQKEYSSLAGLKLGASQTIGNHMLPSILAALNAQYQDAGLQGDKLGLIDPNIQITNHESLCDQVAEFKLDIGLTEGQVSHSDLVALPFASDEMVIACPPNSTLSMDKPMSLDELSDQQWLLREYGSGSREYFIKHVSPSLTSWGELYQFNSATAIINGVSAGLGFCCLSNLSLDASRVAQKLQRVKLDRPLTREYSIVLHKNKFRSVGLNQLVGFMQSWAKSQS
ncbi:LysR substrate-binding domain-containing protein [Vibrio sp. WXL210]|uniref:LysR substrate-binding domain-containing protein n=1 Tax=Vibrio sp. WXL210 TaxID=3450709 RepID=UPI003EC8A4C0